MASLPYDMFDVTRSAAEAQRFERAAAIYHRGQELAWDGREVLAALTKKHGGVRLPAGKRAAVAAVFGPILWGELAAWKISAQLADRLEPLEAKLAATGQAHDEARHFYVMHDYLELALGAVPKKLHPHSERLFEVVLSTDDLACKLLGMQLQIETTALTIFQHLREARVCPVLSELLLYFERDEARHVGLGAQCLPILMRSMDRLQAARLTKFALDVTFWLIASNRAMDPAMRELGLNPRRVLLLAKSKQMIVWEQLWRSVDKTSVSVGDVVSRVMEAAASALWPEEDRAGIGGRVRAFVRALRAGIEQVDTALPPPSSGDAASVDEPRRS